MAVITAKKSSSSKIPPNRVNYSSPIVFDLETTGVDPRKCEIIQIGAIHAVTGEVFERKITFDLELADAGALEMNSYDEDAWEEHAVELHEAMGDFVKFCQKHTNLNRKSERSGFQWKSVMLMGYNSSWFDFPILKRACDKSFKKFFSPWDPRVFDVMHWAMFTYPGYASYKLEAMAALCDCKVSGAHDAVEDSKMTLGIAKSCLQEMFTEESLPKWAQ